MRIAKFILPAMLIATLGTLTACDTGSPVLTTPAASASAICAHPAAPWIDVVNGVTYVCTTTGPVATSN